MIDEAQRRFALYTTKGDRSGITPNLRIPIYRTVIRNGDATAYHALKEEWRSTTSVDGKVITLEAMGKFQDVTLFNDFLEFVFKEVASQDMHTATGALAANSKTRYLLWEYLQANFDTIKTLLGGNVVIFDRFLSSSLQKFNDRKTEKEIADYFKPKDNRGYDRTLAIISDKISSRASYAERDSKLIAEWLNAHGYGRSG